MIRIVPYDSRHLLALLDVVNEHLPLVPPIEAKLTAASLETIVRRYEALWLLHYPEDEEVPVRYRPLVALEDGSPVGLAIVRWEAESANGYISLFIVRAGRDRAADRLLFEAERVLRGEHVTTVDTGDRCPVGLGWFGIPTTWSHLAAAYERAGFEPIDYWVIMTGDAGAIPIEPPRPAGDMPAILLTEHDEQREWLIDLYYDEELVGECHAWGVPPHLESCPGFQGWVTIEWIGIDEACQRRGLAFWLMVKQMHYQLRAGRRRVMLWTGPENQPARNLYHRLYFADGPETCVYRKVLT